MKYIGELLPVDGFRVVLEASLPERYEASLYHLYQPLIGIYAVHLYELFVYEARLTARQKEQIQTHHTLMNHLNLSLREIYEARLKLEGIGLLRTYKEDDETKVFTYELIPPYSPAQFFTDLMLTQLLERHIGKKRFEQLKGYYTPEKTHKKGKQITASFHDVFQTFELKPSVVEKEANIQSQPEITLRKIDFTSLQHSLRQRNLPLANLFTKENKRIITQLANLYDLETYEIEKALLWALTEEHTLDIEQFKAACHDLFLKDTPKGDIKLTFTPEAKKQATNKKNERPETKFEQLIEHFETITPKQLLEDLSDGHQASEQDLKMIRDIMVQQGLPIPVMNVLIHFTMLKTNMMLSRPYMEKVASHWSRAQLKSAREAVEFALQQSKGSTQNRRQSYNRNEKTQEVIPDWFKKRNKQQENQVERTEEDKEAEKEMLAILKKYRSK